MAENFRSLNYGATKPLPVRAGLQHSDERLRLFFDLLEDYAVVLLDVEGRVTDWNSGAAKILGYPPQEILGEHVSVLYPAEDRNAGRPQQHIQIALHQGRFEEDGWRLRKGGSRFWGNVTLTALRDEDAQVYGFGLVIRDISRKDTEELSGRSEERLQLLIEEVRDYAIFLLDPQGHVSSWNRGAQQLKGYREEDILGKHFSIFYPEGDKQAGKPERELEIASREGRVEDEGWRVRRDGSMFWANVVITALRDPAGKLVGFGKVTRDITEKMRAYAELKNTNEQLGAEMTERIRAQKQVQESEESLRMLSRHLLRTQDEERRRIGRDLHDSVGQYLAVLKMSLDTLKHLLKPDNEPAHQALVQCVDLLAESIKEVRTIAYLLYPPMLEETGLRSAIQWYLEGFSKRSGIQTSTDIPAHFGRLPRDVELAMFRVLQESLTNVHRHSGSPTATVRLRVNDATVTLEVQDRGKGIPSEVLQQTRRDYPSALGVGLRGMNERMRQLGGKLDLISGPEGTTVIAMAPCKPTSSDRE